MRKLLSKEFRLAMHPVSIIFLMFAFMLNIPDYFYFVVFFYHILAVFFTFQQGRENNDVVYMLTLPIGRRDVVKARVVFTVIFEMISMAVCIPFAMMSQQAFPEGSIAGLDCNITLFAAALIMYGIFHIVFFPMHYRDVRKIGVPFLIASLICAVYMIAVTGMAIAGGGIMDKLDTPDTMYVNEKLIALAVGIVIYVGLTLAAYFSSARLFEKRGTI